MRRSERMLLTAPALMLPSVTVRVPLTAAILPGPGGVTIVNESRPPSRFSGSR